MFLNIYTHGCVCIHIYTHNKYTQYTYIYYVKKKTFILDAINLDYVAIKNKKYMYKQKMIFFINHQKYDAVCLGSRCVPFSVFVQI